MTTTPTTTTTAAMVLSALPRVAGAGLAAPILHRCAHCGGLDTTAHGALWRVTPLAACNSLYYLHSRCLPAYKERHGLRSVEGRLPRALAPQKEIHA